MIEKLSSSISVAGFESTLYGSKKSSIVAKNRNELANQSLENAIKTSPSELYSIHSLKGDYIKVAFEDERSAQLVSVNLSLKNVAMLRQNFSGKDDFVMRNDGVLRLNGEAQNFVSGWFDKAAYEMNFLAADSDKNGLVKGSELENTKWLQSPSLIATGRKAENASLYKLSSEDLTSYEKALPNDTEKSIETLLNEFLELDTNSDNKITFEEYVSKNGLDKDRMIALRNLDISNASDNIFSKAFDELDKLLKKMREAAMKKSQNPNEQEILSNTTEPKMTALQGYEIASKQENSSNESVLIKSDLNDDENALNAKTSLTQNQNTDKAIENSLSQDLLTQIKNQNLKIIDLRA